MSSSEDYADGWCCTDCLILEANGDTPPDWSEEETEEWLARVGSAGRWTLGRMLESCGCEEWDADAHRDGCERDEFSMCACDVCGCRLGGERHAVTFWIPAEV